MGIFDSVIGDVLGAGGSGSPMAGVLSSMLGGGNQQAGAPPGQGQMGGIAGIVSMFEQAGLGHIAQSWVGNGPNQSVSPDQLQNVLGQGQVQSMANQAGMQPQDFLSQLSQHLPNAVHAMTPDGEVPDQAGQNV